MGGQCGVGLLRVALSFCPPEVAIAGASPWSSEESLSLSRAVRSDGLKVGLLASGCVVTGVESNEMPSQVQTNDGSEHIVQSIAGLPFEQKHLNLPRKARCGGCRDTLCQKHR